MASIHAHSPADPHAPEDLSRPLSERYHAAHHFKDREHEFDSVKMGVWLFLATEILLFSGMFCAYFIFRLMHPEAFIGGGRHLEVKWGLINTIVLLMSSYWVAAGVRHALGEIRYSGNEIATIGKQDLGLSPILVTSLGRSGSTVLAHALGLHPEVAAVGGYPFEYRFFSYCLHAAYVLTSPAGHAHSMGGDAFENRHPFSIGFNPFNHRDYDRVLGHDALRDWYEGPHAAATARFFMGQAREALAIAARGKPGATAFVEKMGGSLLANVAHNLCAGTREIVLLRSFWDVARSMIAFDAKRGTTGFFPAANRGEADAWLRDLADQQRHLERRAQLPGMAAISYEALMGDPQATLAELAAALGLDAGTAAVAAMCEATGASNYSASHSTRAEQGRIDFEAIFSPGAIAAAREMHAGTIA